MKRSERKGQSAARRIRCALLLCALVAPAALGQDVYVPPVPIGIRGEGRVRTPKAPIPFPAADEVWVRTTTPRFRIISSASEEKTRAMAEDLETLASALNHTLTGARATIFVFADRRESQPYFDLLIGREKTAVTGVYVRHEGGGTMLVDAGARGGFERTALHELIHDLLRQNAYTPPLWIEEGLAEYFSTARIRKGTVVAGLPIDSHIALLARMKPPPIEAMFAVRAESPEATAPLFYAESWAAVSWLMQLDAARFDAFVRDVARGTSVERALATHYGKTLDDFRAAIRRAKSRSRELAASPGATQPAVARVPRADVLYELGRFLSHVAGAGEESLRHDRQALLADPRHAPSLAALGRFEEAIAADPANAEVHLTFAESLLKDAVGPFASYYEPSEKDLTAFRKARALAQRALELGADEGVARGMIGTSYLVENDVGPAIPELERARELAPLHLDFALHLFDLYLRTGARAKADALFASAFDHARDKQTLFAARNLLLRFETDRANALAKGGKLDEAAAVVRELARTTEDPLARRELEQQAAQLAATATVNKHIQMYNQAVTLLNSGHKLEAQRLLDELLRVATDAQVVRDAQRLRGEIRMR